MKHYFYLLLIIPFLYSCAARKVAVSKSVLETKIDSVYTEKKDSISVKQNAIVVKEDVYEVVVTPIDSTKPVIIGDVEYRNALVKFKKSNKVTIDSTKTIVVESAVKKVEVEKKLSSKIEDKKVDKKSNYFVYFWLLLLLILLFIAYKLRRLFLIR
jgi:predicted nicotinamide N-methyase